eukprot:TRINITY_DN4553_c0_g1_i7.p1 TRINITY_DN4553_c0_g1~~TRINITY_DN4553_c0_g1_i7.p1  ORF type:complete len:329 (-),score=65.08 TRINITY_DN4553_c0_g1_i7:170-1156(-)
MKILVFISALVCNTFAFVHSDQTTNQNRACPDGFFYAGEAIANETSQITRDSIWVEGPASPVYSCYKFIKAEKTFAGASLECNNIEDVTSQLVSLESRAEDKIVASQLFWDNIPAELKEDVSKYGALTSGIELSPNNWTWFGADAEVDADLRVLESYDETYDDEGVHCLVLRWNMSHNSVDLTYEQIPCTAYHPLTLCEAHVYTQTWYVWFYSNWLQILLFVTMLLLILSACCLFQALFFRTRVRTGQPASGVRAGRRSAPPAYARSSQPPSYASTQQPPAYSTTTTTQDDSFINESPAERYIRKGKEIMAQVTFFKPVQPEKPPLPH